MPKIILLNGPPAAGKTTVAKHFIKTREPEEWAYVSHDEIRGLVTSGHTSADGLRSTWDDRTRKQWLVGTENCIDVAMNFIAHGISVVTDFYATRIEFEEVWQKRFDNTGTKPTLIILLPDSDAELQRNNTRVGPSHLQTDKMLESIKDFQDWRSYKDALVIDNSKMSIEETADQIASVL